MNEMSIINKPEDEEGDRDGDEGLGLEEEENFNGDQ